MPEKNNRKETDFPLLLLNSQELRVLRHIWLLNVPCYIRRNLSHQHHHGQIHKIHDVIKDNRGMY